MSEILNRFKRCLPIMTEIIDKTLETIQKEIDVKSSIKANVSESSNKIIFTIPLSGISKDDVDFSCEKDKIIFKISKSKNK